jgi:L-cysteine:1D-myo-inositol 2-amino-2-deoxy-alpha-D-glucopyranoside ligase
VLSAGDVLDQVRERLADDLDAPGALAVIDSWVSGAPAGGSTAVSGSAADEAALIRDTADALLGIAL